MAKGVSGTGRAGVKPPERWRCMIPGCAVEGVWQDVLPGEEFVYVTSDKRSHYWQAHYLASEAEYKKRRDDAVAARRAHYQATGQMRPMEEFLT